MADEQAYITASASVINKSVSKNGLLLFSDKTKERTGDFLLAAYKHFNMDYPKFYKMDNLCKLGFVATEILLNNNRISEKYKPEEVGIVCSNANASLDADINYFESVKNIPSPAQFVYTLPNIVIGEISIRHRFKGENAFFVSEKFNEQLMWWYVKDALNRTQLKACICGWIDCLDEKYEAVLWLVEKKPGENTLVFNIEHIHQTYELANGKING
ncbi:MAG: hypothetical protein QM802_06200 [Agriterribacter sp.]